MTPEEQLQIEKHYEEVRKYEEKRWHERMWVYGILIAVIFLGLGTLIGSCVPVNRHGHSGRSGESGGGWHDR